MHWDKIAGQTEIKQKLKESVAEGRISHAQLFVGKEGSGALAMAIAYAGEVLSQEKGEIALAKVNSLQHPDLHFAYPVASTDSVKDKPTSLQFLREWREFFLENPYGNIFDWLQFLGIEKKQGNISVHEAQEIVKTLSLNSYEGGYKIMIIWLPELMNNAAANKLLKIIEEPPQKTLFLLVSEREDLLLPTITSRCQMVKLNRLSDAEIADYLKQTKDLSEIDALRLAVSANGNLREALSNLDVGNGEFEAYFIQWVRNAFMAAKNPNVLKNLVEWANELSGWSREQQKQFLSYCSEVFRQALLQNYQAADLVFMRLDKDGFNWGKFSPYIHGANIEDILNEINESSYHIERNANSKIVLLDLSIKLTRHLHKKG